MYCIIVLLYYFYLEGQQQLKTKANKKKMMWGQTTIKPTIKNARVMLYIRSVAQ